MSKSRCLLVLVFLGSIVFLPMASWADALHPRPISITSLPDPPRSISICDHVGGNLVKNCGFETGDFSEWTQKHAASGSLLEITPVFHSGNFAAAFGASGTTDDAISQLISDTVGRAFQLSFFLENGQSTPAGKADFSASWDGSRVFSAKTAAFPYTQFSFVVPGTGRDTLQFSGRIIPSFYFLDDIVVTPVPEPGTLGLVLLGTGLIGLAGLRRRKLDLGTLVRAAFSLRH